MFERLFYVDPDAGEADLRAQVEQLERVKSDAAAAQARATAAWAARREAAEAAAGMPRRKRGRGLTTEIALARRDAPVYGNTHLGMARALADEMPHTLAALACGALSEWRATLIVRESACLRVEDRRRLDTELCSDATRFDGWSNSRVAAEAKRIAARLDVAAVVDRTARRAADRRVTIRPADRPVSVSLNLVLADTTLVGDDEEPGWCEGYGPVPAAVVRALVGDAVRDDTATATLRRRYRHPRSGALVAMESRARRFPKGLAAFIDIRDRTCRTPYCDAPIRHHDHARPHRGGGATSARNGLGECEACNYAKEAPGWVVTTEVLDGEHRADFRTPTGAIYRSTAPPPPGPPIRTRSVMEDGLVLDLVRFDAA